MKENKKPVKETVKKKASFGRLMGVIQSLNAIANDSKLSAFNRTPIGEQTIEFMKELQEKHQKDLAKREKSIHREFAALDADGCLLYNDKGGYKIKPENEDARDEKLEQLFKEEFEFDQLQMSTEKFDLFNLSVFDPFIKVTIKMPVAVENVPASALVN